MPASGRTREASRRCWSVAAMAEWSSSGRDSTWVHRDVSRRLLASRAGSAYTRCMQYTIRGIPPAIDHALRKRATAAGKSPNEAAIIPLGEGAGVTGAPRKRRDMSDIAGTWQHDKAVEPALA